jgi:N-acetylmuramoyl-L-alanine amidase
MLLRMGDRGEAVKVVQQALREAGFDIVVDGIFGRNTRAAVMEFQRQSSLTVDGIVGPQTLSALGLDPALTEDGLDSPSDHSDPLEENFNEGSDSRPEGTVNWRYSKKR